MHPYLEQDFFSFIITLWQRFFLFLVGALRPQDLVSEDMQFLALILSGTLGIIVGFYLIYNKMTMLANSLSHTVLLGLVVTFLTARLFDKSLGVDDLEFYLQLLAAAFTAVITMIGLKFLLKKISSEASNALSFTAFFALGILMTSLILKNTHLGLESVLGNLEAIAFSDIASLFFALIMTVIVLAMIKTRLNLISFDELFAQTIGIKAGIYRNILIFISAVVLIVCFRSMGVILILSMLTSPVLVARLFSSSRKKIMSLAFIFLLVQVTLCLAIVQLLYVELDLPVSTGGLFGFMGLLSYLIALILMKRRQVIFKNLSS